MATNKARNIYINKIENFFLLFAFNNIFIVKVTMEFNYEIQNNTRGYNKKLN